MTTVEVYRIGIINQEKNKAYNERVSIAGRKFHKCLYCLADIEDKRRSTCNDEHSKLFWKEFGYWELSWQTLRAKALERDHSKCVKCENPADEVDHIIEIADGGKEFDISNLQSLCYKCHRKKSGESAHLRAISRTEKGQFKLEELTRA